jgi:ATP-dependent Clp protease ATP-binding subunit ClpC
MEKQLEIILTNSSQFPQMNKAPEIIDHIHESLEDMPLPTKPITASYKKNKKESILDYFGIELTNPEIEASIDPVIGRDKEIERMMQILCRRTKNNPILLGDPGVGKTAIVEGLAKKIATGAVPDILLNKKIYAIDMGLLIAGTAYRGEFEGRLRQVIEEATNNPDIILFIDELHNIVGAGSNQGNMDAGNILKPALARGNIRCIGATTPTEFKKHIESDPALERRFQPIHIKESSIADTITIMKGIKHNYEQYHNVIINDAAIEQAAILADRYITNKLLPDKAIDLLDETAAAKRLTLKPTPIQIKLWKLKQELSTTIRAKEDAAGNDNFDKAVQLKEKEQVLIKEIKTWEQKNNTKKSKPASDEITEKDIAKQLAKIIDRPIKALNFGKSTGSSDLETELKKQIIGQDEVIGEVAEIMLQTQLELSSTNRPLASFLFVGESGVGKTELAKTLAKTIYPHQNSLIHLNMSEFNESFGVSKLLGSPAGYIGYKETNQFTDRVKMNPHSVILFDEIDKAHKDVTKLLLQILENGSITDSTGRQISLRHATIILTTSLGADEIKKSQIGFEKNSTPADNKKLIIAKLKEFFSPELINRIDQISIFNSLSKTDLAKIAALEIQDLNKQLERYHTRIDPDKNIFDWFVNQQPTATPSAREIRRQIRKQTQKIISELIITEKIKPAHKLVLHKNQLTIS